MIRSVSQISPLYFLQFFSRCFSISAMYSWCSNCAIRICICSSSLRGSCSCLRLPRRSSSPDSPVSLYFSVHVRAWLRLTSCSSLLLRLSDSPTSRLQDLPGLYYFQLHLRHLLAPFPFWRPVVPFSVALLRCIPLPLARAKNSQRILAHSHLEIVLVVAHAGCTQKKLPRICSPRQPSL